MGRLLAGQDAALLVISEFIQTALIYFSSQVFSSLNWSFH